MIILVSLFTGALAAVFLHLGGISFTLAVAAAFAVQFIGGAIVGFIIRGNE